MKNDEIDPKIKISKYCWQYECHELLIENNNKNVKIYSALFLKTEIKF